MAEQAANGLEALSWAAPEDMEALKPLVRALGWIVNVGAVLGVAIVALMPVLGPLHHHR